MKKLLALALSLALLCCFSPALAQSEMLTVDEIMDFCDQMLSDALGRTPVSASAAEDGGYMFVFDGYTLYSPDATLSQNARITGVDLYSSHYLVADMRGICPTDTLSSLLAAYPLDNTNLQGTYDEAVLYIGGHLPDTVNTGRVIRNGSHALVVEHSTYAMDGEQVEKSCVVYTLENNFVIAVQLMLDAQHMVLEEAQAELAELSILQEKNEYSIYTAENPEPLTREDLSFGEMDFLTVTPESALNLMGGAQSDTWAQDGQGYLRTLQWSDVQLIFSYDASRQSSRLILLEVYGESLEGPRNLHLGDSVESVIARFEHAQATESGVLYGDGQQAPYGKYEVHADGSAYVLYAAQAENATVLVALTFVDNALVDITCTYL